MTIRKTRVATVIGTVAVFASVALLVAQRDDVTTETSIELEPDQANKRFLGSEELELFFGSSQLTEARVDEVSPAVILVETPLPVPSTSRSKMPMASRHPDPASSRCGSRNLGTRGVGPW